MVTGKDNILEYQHMKSEKMPYITYTSTIKIGEHIPCGYSMSTIFGI